MSTDAVPTRTDPTAAPLPPPTFFSNQFQLLRDEDQLHLDVVVRGLTPVIEAGVCVLVHEVPAQTAQIQLQLAAQHVMDRAGSTPLTRHVISEPTLLTFLVPPGHAPIPFSIVGILDAVTKLPVLTPLFAETVAPLPAPPPFVPADALANAITPLATAASRREQVVDLAGRGAAQADLVAVAPDPSSASVRATAETAAPAFLPPPPNPLAPTTLAISTRLELAVPGNATRFAHASEPVTHDGRTELWTSHLARLRLDGALVEQRTDLVAIRARQSTTTNTAWQADVGNVSGLTPTQADVVASQALHPLTVEPNRRPLKASHVHLGGLGASMDIRGNWPLLSIKSWRHRTASGRDQYQRLVQVGRLYPFGLDAILTTTTERAMVADRNGSRAALRSRNRITVQEPVATFPGNTKAGRQFPFASVEVLTTETPDGTLTTLTGSAQYLKVGSATFRYKCVATDRVGRPVRFELPLVFVPDSFTQAGGSFATLATEYANRPHLCNANIDGQTVALTDPGAPGGASAAAAETNPTDTVNVLMDIARLGATSSSDFKPIVRELTGRVPSIERFTNELVPRELRYATQFVEFGFGPGNTGEALLGLVGAAPQLGIVNQGATGGLLTALSLPATGVSRKVGPIGGTLANAAADLFDVQQWFGAALDDLKILGVVPLKQLIDLATDPATLPELSAAPAMVQSVVDGIRTQSFTWTTPLFPTGAPVDVPGGLAQLRPSGTGASQLRIEAIATSSGGTVTATATCTISNVLVAFGLGDGDLVRIPFTTISFVTVDGRKPDIDVQLGSLEFDGILAFVSVLAQLVDPAGFHDPPALDVRSDGITSSFSAPIPAVAVGVFSLENITFGAALDIYFADRAPELALNFATFDNPFRLTVAFLGGGGYLGVALSASQGLVRLEGALEFGAAISINLGVAKGSVSAMGGVYFLIEGGEALITAYFRVKGQLSVLGLITVSVELLLAMAYETESKLLRGRAEMSIKVKMLFLSKTVKIEMERTFAGSNADPTFAELMDPAGATAGARPWDQYCLAFAA